MECAHAHRDFGLWSMRGSWSDETTMDAIPQKKKEYRIWSHSSQDSSSLMPTTPAVLSCECKVALWDAISHMAIILFGSRDWLSEQNKKPRQETGAGSLC